MPYTYSKRKGSSCGLLSRCCSLGERVEGEGSCFVLAGLGVGEALVEEICDLGTFMLLQEKWSHGLPGQALLESRLRPSWRCEPHFSAFWIWESRQNPDLYVKCPDISILATSLK